MLTFKAGLAIVEVHFKADLAEDGIEPLGFEHFYFPLVLWLAGIILSAFFLLAEILFHRVTQSTQHPEV